MIASEPLLGLPFLQLAARRRPGQVTPNNDSLCRHRRRVEAGATPQGSRNHQLQHSNSLLRPVALPRAMEPQRHLRRLYSINRRRQENRRQESRPQGIGLNAQLMR
jgi:hypothetical protein